MNPVQENFEELFRKALESEKITIPKEEKANLIEHYKNVLEVKSLFELDCDLETYNSLANELLGEAENFNLFNLSVLINGLSKTSARDLGIPFGVHSMVMFYNKELADLWNELVVPIRKKLVDKLKTQAVLTAPKNGMKVIPNGRR